MQRFQLTDREDEVLGLVLGGLSNEQIATRLAISRRTVEAHLRTLFRKTGVSRRAQLVALYRVAEVRNGLAAPRGLDADDAPDATAALGATDPLGATGALGATDGPARPRSRQRAELINCQEQLRRYANAVHGLVDRQFPLFGERVEITLTVGEQDGQDIVVERRWTTPRPYLVYRILGPIVSWRDGVPFDPDQLALTCNVHGQDVRVEIHEVRDVNGRPLVMILFQPGLHTDTEWELSYRSPALWSPLRASGQDSLTWSTATFDQRHPATTSDLTLKVVFPVSWTAERLTEQSNAGAIHTERLSTGQTQLTWHHDAPHVGVYQWFLQGSPPRS